MYFAFSATLRDTKHTSEAPNLATSLNRGLYNFCSSSPTHHGSLIGSAGRLQTAAGSQHSREQRGSQSIMYRQVSN